MALTLAEKIIREHLAEGELAPGNEIAIRVDQTLTQDATGTMACLEFESLGVEKVRTELSVSYVDHNTLQSGFENADDHRFLRTFAARHGILFSRPGNGICHQVHLERFGRPGAVLLGSDSHTPTGGGLGMLAIGVGGLEIAAAMAGHPYRLLKPEVFRVRLSGRLGDWVGAKDVILEVLRRLTVKGGVGKILEYCGEGVETLSVPERATIANMGAETGATTSIFPSDLRTLEFLRLQGRAQAYLPLAADPGAAYAGELELDLSVLEPLTACPHSPDLVRPVRELAGMRIDQVCIGSCTNSSLRDLTAAAEILRGRTVPAGVSLVVSPGSRQVLRELAADGSLESLIASGARIMENACGPCIGMGQAPPSGGVSLRTYNRNFKGRSGTADAAVYLVSPETAAASARAGVFTDPRTLGKPPAFAGPEILRPDDSLIVIPPAAGSGVEVVKGPNISSVPAGDELPDSLEAEILLVAGDNVTTDDIMPAGAKILPLRSNIGKISRFVFRDLAGDFAAAAAAAGAAGRAGAIVGGANYGQGSSREHAALAPRYLGVRVVIAKSFARIHKSNLINFGILPLILPPPAEGFSPARGDILRFDSLRRQVREQEKIRFRLGEKKFRSPLELTPRERELILAGGMLNLLRGRA